MCFALIHNVTLRVKEFQGKTSTPRGPERLGQPTPCKAKCARLAAFDKIGNVFSLTYSQMIAQQFRQLHVYCRHLCFMKTGHDIDCCVFNYRECIMHWTNTKREKMETSIFQTLKGSLLCGPWSDLAEFQTHPSSLYVIITCRYEKDPIKNNRDKVATPFFKL